MDYINYKSKSSNQIDTYKGKYYKYSSINTRCSSETLDKSYKNSTSDIFYQKYCKYKKKYLDLLKLTGGASVGMSSQEERNRMNNNTQSTARNEQESTARNEEDQNFVFEAMINVMEGNFYATNMDEFLGQWIIPSNQTPEEFQTTLAAFDDNKTRKEYILDLTRTLIFNELLEILGDSASDIISRLVPNSAVTGDNLQDFIIMNLPFLNPYINPTVNLRQAAIG